MLLLSVFLALQGQPFTSEMWPEEGIPQLAAKTSTLPLHMQASRAAPMHRLRVKKGALIPFDSTRYTTLRPGRLVARSSGSVMGRVLGRISYLSRALYYTSTIRSREIPYNHGDTLEYLQYRAEGTCLMRIEGDVVDAEDCPALHPDGFTVLSQPLTEWWIWVHTTVQPRGWLLVDPTTVDQLERRF
jgi:hypothetical protein